MLFKKTMFKHAGQYCILFFSKEWSLLYTIREKCSPPLNMCFAKLVTLFSTIGSLCIIVLMLFISTFNKWLLIKIIFNWNVGCLHNLNILKDHLVENTINCINYSVMMKTISCLTKCFYYIVKYFIRSCVNAEQFIPPNEQ